MPEARPRIVPAAPRPADAFLRTVGWGAAIVALALSQVWVQLQTRELRYENARRVALHQALEDRKRELEVSLARLRSPDRVAALAEERLGLGRADTRQLVTIR